MNRRPPIPATGSPPPDAGADTERRGVLRAIGGLGLLASGCGGGTDVAGVGTGGTGQIASSSFTTGSISGFGSVIVNGIRYDDTAARILDDGGRTRAASQLAIGMVVEIEGRADETAGTGSADTVRVVSGLRGPVSSIDAAGRRFTVLGVPVQTGTATAFPAGGGFAGLTVGMSVEVFGFPDETAGLVRATLVLARSSSDTDPPLQLRGTIASFASGATTFEIGPLTIDYRLATIENLPSGGLRNGLLVRVEGTRAVIGTTWRPDRVVVLTQTAGTEGRVVRIEGTISGYESVSRFLVAGLPVDAFGAAFSGGATVAGLRNGLRVRVTGTVTNARIAARTLQLRDDDEVSGQVDDEAEFKGTIIRFTRLADFAVRDSAGRVFLVEATAATTIEDGTVADVRVGAVVEVKGRRGAVIVATRLKIGR
ncbi:MAG: DUF5666 domain-containing protein [Burkholderiaceae bacterium]